MKSSITPCLWFDKNAEEAVSFYTSLFPASRIVRTSHYGHDKDTSMGQEPGSVLTIDFELNGQRFTALNAGPHVKFNEAVSLQVFCKDQEELDSYWNKLTADGGKEGVCGWLTDKFGVSWQVAPEMLAEQMSDPAKSDKLIKAIGSMKKLDIAKLNEALEN